MPKITKAKRKAIHKLYRAFEYLRPRMVASEFPRIEPNPEALAGTIIARAMRRIRHHDH